jgi:hypothetical protein
MALFTICIGIKNAAVGAAVILRRFRFERGKDTTILEKSRFSAKKITLF